MTLVASSTRALFAAVPSVLSAPSRPVPLLQLPVFVPLVVSDPLVPLPSSFHLLTLSFLVVPFLPLRFYQSSFFKRGKLVSIFHQRALHDSLLTHTWRIFVLRIS